MAALAAELHEPDDTPRAAREPREFSAIQVCGLTLRSFFRPWMAGSQHPTASGHSEIQRDAHHHHQPTERFRRP